MHDLRFDLNDDLNVTELRNIDAWQSRLSGAGKLRLQLHGEIVGVLLSPDEWLALKAQVEVSGDAPAVGAPAVRAPADAIRELVQTVNNV